jgi:4-diphosphocytidyl-2-C-methyl-D-erythritol kinase
MTLNISAPAKVNLILRVLGRRADGYHDLFMLMERLSLADKISLTETQSGVELELKGTKPDQGMLAQKNLAYRAAQTFKEATGEKRGVKIELTKNIPIAAGLGGGSSDAAAVLKGLNELWDKRLVSSDLAVIGAKLGADVPFFCFDGPALAKGIGERITPIEPLPKMYFLLINPGFSVPTPWVYNEFSKTCGADVSRLNSQSSILGFNLTAKVKDASFRRLFDDCHGLAAVLENDLEKVTIKKYPEIEEIKEFFWKNGALGALMSGSGPTVFGIFESKQKRDAALSKIPMSNWQAFTAENEMS